MPAKFKPSERIVSRVRGQKKYKHYYLKQTPKAELFAEINSDRTKPKHKVKYVNELVRRGIKIEWISKEELV